ncbi:F0F1 ATP synthase subunit epsilon [Brevibacterium sp. 50QC2O2]|jgi:F-type H+-transporting ATPase subunit epsilon|uniref:F0F1 ATP synthase subunit epsilon n=1 Tax=Brevibacterium TaxID=1696 RepID=UPI00211C0767|nr:MULTISPECIES: F0F1 ATP synthase subunit epsilon [unclassified Brevibacterium]MCQ9368302.1 F0F1 ATP synthase subunit epsilon [Brevibacterium sp. 91QC2O2]MCQ9384804.1 F0F1 ATP synthase subunit epsilon [Brevibacterium sp. 68QC2CO]MCQ9387566.1 F0F1 ATP synthase subunit epsilon [Brevibacterium sp. 50QC2O2]
MALNVTVAAAHAAVWSGEATRVSAKTVDGSIGILSGHEPVLGVLAPGEVTITTPSGDVVKVHSDGGFLSVNRDDVTVAADSAELIK